MELPVALAPETERMAQRAREMPRRAETTRRKAAQRARAVVTRMRRDGLTGRGIARCPGVSQRFSRLLAQDTAEKSPGAA